MGDYFFVLPDAKWLHTTYKKKKSAADILEKALVKAMLQQLNEEHEEDLAFLHLEIKEAEEANIPMIVLTHHAPTMLKTSADFFQTPLHNEMNFGFANNLEFYFKHFGQRNNSTVAAWICGHTHNCANVDLFGTRVVSNQRGEPEKFGRYPTKYKPDMRLMLTSSAAAAISARGKGGEGGREGVVVVGGGEGDVNGPRLW